MARFTTLTSPLIPLVRNDIDTDQIIPARFLKVTDKLGLGEKLFSDWRYSADGSPLPDVCTESTPVPGPFHSGGW